jgi:hypothetical protein
MRAKGREGEEAGEEYLAIVIDGVGKEKEGRNTNWVKAEMHIRRTPVFCFQI